MIRCVYKKRVNNRIYLSIVYGYRDEKNKVKHKTIKTYRYLVELEKQYDNPLDIIEKKLENLKSEDINELTIRNINQILKNYNTYKNDEKTLIITF